jgi:hypothetical protein
MKDQKRDQNPPPPAGENQNGLRGGTQGGEPSPTPDIGGRSGGTNSLSPTGASQPDQGPASPPGGAPPQSGGTRTDSRDEPEELFEGSRKPSHATAKQRARDDADVDTTHGQPPAPGNPKQHDETDPTGQSHSTGAAVTKASTGEKGVGEKK